MIAQLTVADLMPHGPSPCPVPDATWQPGVIAGSESKRVFLNGEPVAGAVAASDYLGWVMVCVGYEHDGPDLRPSATRRIHGRVEIRSTRW